MSRLPLSRLDRMYTVPRELDTQSPLGIAILSEGWLNFTDRERNYWIGRLRAGVIDCTIRLCRRRAQVELSIILHPGETVFFCITLAHLERFT